MPTANCIERDELREFSLGRVEDDRFESIQSHLSECPVCEDTVASFDDTADSLIANVRVATRDDEVSNAGIPAESAVLRDVLAKVSGQPAPPRADVDPAPQQVVERIRDYELVEQLGAGGMGTVYRALHTRLEREVALKLLPARRLRDAAAVARFEREMKAIGRLDHPAIVRATDAGVVDGTHFLAMDYVEGIDISRLVRLDGPLDVASACELIRQAAIGLQYAHEQGLIHRDVKPSNLMLNRRGEVRILDLGLALFGAASEAVDELTTVGQLMGTLDYMAPEQCDNSHDVDARADVYSLGATLFKLLSGTAPYDTEGQKTPLAKMKALATIDAPSLADRSVGLPVELIELVDRSLSRDCDDRFASASDMAAELEPFCVDHKLTELAERGLALAAEADVEPDLPATIPPFVRRSEADEEQESRLQTAPAQQPPEGGTPARRASLMSWLLMPIVLLAGVVFWIQTDNGTLHIECADDDIPIEIRKGTELVKTETLSIGPNELTIRSGRYEIVLLKEYDSLKVEDGSIELTRGGNDYARITRVKDGPPPTQVEIAAGPRETESEEAAVASSTVSFPVELIGESANAKVGDKVCVQLMHSRGEPGDFTARTIAQGARVSRRENVHESVDRGVRTVWCDVTLTLPPADAERVKRAVRDVEANDGDAGFLLSIQNPHGRGNPIGVIPPGMRVVLVEAYEPLGLSRLTTAGDLVDLNLTCTRRGSDEPTTMLVTMSAEVFSVERGQFGPGEKVEVVPPIRVGVIVKPEDAERLLVARHAGRLDVVGRQASAGLRPAQHVFEPSVLPIEKLEEIARLRRDVDPFQHSPASGSGPDLEIPRGMVVITIPGEDSLVKDGLLVPGDRVDVFVTLVVRNELGTGKSVKTVEEFVKVFSVDTSREVNSDSLDQTSIVALLVKPEQAMRIKLAEDAGRLHLAIRSKEDTGERTAQEDLFDPKMVEASKKWAMVSVLVATAEVARGGALNTDNVEFREVPDAFIPPNVITVPAEYQDRSTKVNLFPGDFVTVDKLSRKGDVAAAIGAVDQGYDAKGANPEPVFSGKTFDQWKREVLTERNPEELESAVNALCILGRGYRDREAAEAVLQILRPYPLDSLPARHTGPQTHTPDTKLVITAIRQLRGLKSKEIAKPIINSLKEDSPLLHRMVIEWLAETSHISIQALVGNREPLRSTLLYSPDYVDAILDRWDAFDEVTRQTAFWTIWELAGDGKNEKLVARLEDIVGQPKSEFRVEAARLLAKIRPRPELASVFLETLETPFTGGSSLGGKAASLWWEEESTAWLGLASLGEHAKGSVPRIAALLTVLEKKNALDDGTTLTVPAGNNSYLQIPFSRRMLIYELLGRLGSEAKSAEPVIVASLEDYFGVAPDPEGDFGFTAAEERFLLDHRNIETATIFNIGGGYGGGAGGGFFSVIDRYGDEIARAAEVPTLYGTVLNAGVFALQRITGQPVRYADTVFRKHKPAPASNEAGGFLTPDGPKNNQGIPVAWFPKLVTYRGRSFGEWQSAAASVHEAKLSFKQMEDVISGLSVLRDENHGGDHAAARSISRILRHVLATQSFFASAKDVALATTGIPASPDFPAGTPVMLEEPFNLAMTAYGRVHDYDGSLASNIANDTLKNGTDQARWLVVYWIANPQTQFADSEYPISTEYSWNLNGPGFAASFRDMFDDREWQAHSDTLKRAMVRLAWRYATKVERETDHVDTLLSALMKRLDTEKDPFLRTELAIVLSRFQATGAASLPGTMLRKTQSALVEALNDIPNGISLVDIVVALDETSGNSIDVFTERLVNLIIQDSADDAEIKAAYVRVASSRQSAGAMGMGGYPGGGIASGLPGFGGGAGGMAGMMGGSGMPPHQSRIVSRRLLLVQMLTESPLKVSGIRKAVAAKLVALIDTPLSSFVEDRTPLKHIRRAWQEGTRTPGSKPAKADAEAEAFTNAVVNCVLSLEPGEDIQKQLFGQNDATATVTAPPRVGVYDGRNYRQWLETVEIERSPAKLAEAVRALRLLGAGEHDAEVATAILNATRLFDVFNFASESPEAQFLYAADDQLRQLDVESIFPSVIAALQQGNATQRKFVVIFLAGTGLTPGKSYRDNHRQIVAHLNGSSEFQSGLIEVWNRKDSTPTEQMYLFSVIEEHLIHGEKTAPAIVAFLKHILDSPPSADSPADASVLESEERQRWQRAAFHLAVAAPNDATLPKLLVDELERPLKPGTTWWTDRSNIVLGLTRLRRKAISQLPRLVKMLAERSASDYPVNNGSLFVHDRPKAYEDMIVFNERIALVELIHLIVNEVVQRPIPEAARDGVVDAIVLISNFARQKPRPGGDPERYPDLSVADVSKDTFALARLLQGREQESRIDEFAGANDQMKYKGVYPIEAIEPMVFVKTAQLSLASLHELKLPGIELPELPDGTEEADPNTKPENAPAGQAGVYDGRDYKQWLRTVEAERSPERLTEAVQALRLLGAGRHDSEVATAILSAIGRFPGARWDGNSSEGQLLSAAVEQLRHLDPSKVLAPVIETFRSGNIVQRSVVITLTYFGPNSEDAVETISLAKLLTGSAEVRDTIISEWGDLAKSPSVAASAYEFLNRHWIHGEKTHANVIRFLKQLADAEMPIPETRPTDVQTPEQRLYSLRYARRLQAAFTLSQLAPDHQSLIDVFVDDLMMPDRDRFWDDHSLSVVGLLRLRNQAQRHLPRLISALKAASDLKTVPKSCEVLQLTNNKTEQRTDFLISRRIVLAELVALIATADESGESTEQLGDLFQQIQEQSPKKDEVAEQYLPHLTKTQFVVPQLAAGFGHPHKWIESSSGSRYMLVSTDRGPAGSVHPATIEPYIFQQTARLELLDDSASDAADAADETDKTDSEGEDSTPAPLPGT